MPIQLFTSKKQLITIEDQPFESGGEGAIYKIITAKDYQNHCVKLYFTPFRTPQKEEKTLYQVHNPPPNLSNPNFIICWPQEVVYENAMFAGFLMPLAYPGSKQLYELCLPTIKPALQHVLLAKYNRETQAGIIARYKLCVNIAIAIHTIHNSKQYVLVDAKPQNILFTHNGKISITDIDSIQISNDSGMVIYHAAVATPEYTPPEGHNGILSPANTPIPQSWDNFALAVIFYELLLGLHPYAATFRGAYAQQNTLSEKIQNGLFVHGANKNKADIVPPLHNNYIHLPDALQTLFYNAFDTGHNNPLKRPDAEQWGNALYNELKLPYKNNPQAQLIKPPLPPKTAPPKPTIKQYMPKLLEYAVVLLLKIATFIRVGIIRLVVGLILLLIIADVLHNITRKQKTEQEIAEEIVEEIAEKILKETSKEIAEAVTVEEAIEIIKQIEADMVPVQGGTFTMGCTIEQGSDCNADEKPAHKVTLSNFSIGRFEITQEQWRSVMRTIPPNLYNEYCSSCPVNNVSYYDVQRFLVRLNELSKMGAQLLYKNVKIAQDKIYRLPTEAEWEFAARGGTKSKGYKYAGTNNLDEVACYSLNRKSNSAHPIGEKKPNELGLYDMSGNVWEWCQDGYDREYYTKSADSRNPLNSGKGNQHVTRGGSWSSYPDLCRTSYRQDFHPNAKFDDVGFRLCRVALNPNP